MRQKVQLPPTYNMPNNHLYYAPTQKQIRFFFTVKISKSIGKDEEPLTQVGADEQYGQDTVWGAQITHQLDVWGERVTKLQQREEQMWQLFLQQVKLGLKRSARKYSPSNSLDVAEQMVTDTVIKVMKMLEKMLPVEQIEATEEAVGLAVERQHLLKGTYEFASPFYGYINRMGERTVIDFLRKNRPKPEISIDELEASIPAAPDSLMAEEELQEAEQKLTAEFHLLLKRIQETLPATKRRVILHTLAMRPQFWNLLEYLEIDCPDDIPDAKQFSDDETLAAELGTNKSNIRSSRSQARAQLIKENPNLAVLITRLLADR